MTRPRASTVLRRFMEGESINDLAHSVCRQYSMEWDAAWDHIEAIIRRALNKSRSKKR